MHKILIIDDDAAYRFSLKTVLEDEGYTVLEAPDGKQGVSLYKKELPDVVITDIVMPEKDGIEVITELKSKFPDVKIIAISGGGASKNVRQLLSISATLGADYTFVKSYKNKPLLTAIKDLLPCETFNLT